MTEKQPNTIKSALREELICALCQDLYNNPQTLIPCLHTFCLNCVTFIPRDHQDKFNCPICRGLTSSFSNNFSIQNFIDILENINLFESNSGASNSSANILNDTPQADTNREESLLIEPNDQPQAESSSTASTSSSYQSVINFGSIKKPCRSCIPENGTGHTCSMPITDEQQDGFGHILCVYCLEYLPARGLGGNEPALNQCCSFCGVVTCDEYWECKNKSTSAKLYILNEASNILQLLKDVDSIETKEDGHLNLSEIKYLGEHLQRSNISWTEAWNGCLIDLDENYYTAHIARRMTPLAHQIYNTRRLPNHDQTTEEEDEDEDEDGYYDHIREEGVLPSRHLRACYTCLVTLVNGQFYGYWKSILDHGLTSCTREICPRGIQCDTQWRMETHAERLSHVEAESNDSV